MFGSVVSVKIQKKKVTSPIFRRIGIESSLDIALIEKTTLNVGTQNRATLD